MKGDGTQSNSADAKVGGLTRGVVPMMMGFVLLGMLAGAALAWMFVPDLLAASALGGGMMFGAIRAFAYLFATPPVLELDDIQDRTDQR
ncbi:MAG: hypothetical protein AB8B47_09720 [Roseobacter sp.]